ncbi:MAG: hypothetical protein ACJA2D_000840 [Pseudohongiellaceae bacterium]|jgi:hypothetical protein
MTVRKQRKETRQALELAISSRKSEVIGVAITTGA